MSEQKEKQKTVSMLVIEIPQQSTQAKQMNHQVSYHSVAIEEASAINRDQRQSKSSCSFSRSVGLIINLALLVSVTCYYALQATRQLGDPVHYDSVFKGACWPTIIQLFDITLTLDLMMSAIILIIVFPLSRVKRTTISYTLISVVCSAVMFTLMFFLARHMTLTARIITVIDVTRLCMKMISFLLECKKSDHIFSTSSVLTLRYYLFIPNLMYRTQYAKTDSINWLKVLRHLWWIWIALFPFMSLVSGLFTQLSRFDMTTNDFSSLAINISTLTAMSLVTFAIVVYFFLFRNLFALRAQLLRFHRSNGFGVKKWFIEYIYSPKFEESKSNYSATVYLSVCSLLIIEFFAVYSFQVLIVLNSLLIVTLLPLLILPVHRNRLFSWTAVLVIVSLNLFAYLMDSVVVNSGVSTNSFQVRLIPAFVRLLLQQHCNIDIGSLEWIYPARGIFPR